MILERAKKCVDLLFAEDVRNSELVNKTGANGLIIKFIGGESFLETDLVDWTMLSLQDPEHRPKRMHIPRDWAVEIIGAEEYERLLELERRAHCCTGMGNNSAKAPEVERT